MLYRAAIGLILIALSAIALFGIGVYFAILASSLMGLLVPLAFFAWAIRPAEMTESGVLTAAGWMTAACAVAATAYVATMEPSEIIRIMQAYRVKSS